MYTSDKEFNNDFTGEPSAYAGSGAKATEVIEPVEVIKSEDGSIDIRTAKSSKERNFSDMTIRYLIASAVIAAAGLIYECFSHGVYSVFMYGAFLIPLIGGALPWAVRDILYRKKLSEGSPNQLIPSGPEVKQKGQMIRELQLAAIATLTTGSLIQGALVIYGTTNRLMIAFPAAGLAIAIAAAVLAAVSVQPRTAGS
ncbi:MAG: hypothetical protein IJH92_00195 [Mogibacterium sp.]|nr:hypothetical protein [Mogibacterium sp.]